MILVLASRFDVAAGALVQGWEDDGARLLTCAALSRPGWRFDPGRPADGCLVVDEEPVPVSDVRALVSLLPGVHPAELPHIAVEDREYVAGEMMAFLVAWLSALPCRVLNRPTPLCLTGPHLRPEQWVRAAVTAGLPARVATRRVPDTAAKQPAAVPVTVVAGHVVRCADTPSLSASTLAGLERLAAVACAGLLTALFADGDDGLEFVGALPTVDVQRSEVADAMLAAIGQSA